MDNESRGGDGGYTCRKCGFYNHLSRAQSPPHQHQHQQSTSSTSSKRHIANRKQPPNAPKGLDEFLLNFTVSIIEQQPNDLEQFAYDYFNNIHLKKTTRGYMNSGGTSSSGGGGGGGNNTSRVNSNGGGGGGGGGIPTIVMSAAVESPTNEESAITNEFENMRLSNMSRAQGRRFSVFNKAFDPESSSQDSESSADGTKIKIGESSYHNDHSSNGGNDRVVGGMGGVSGSPSSLAGDPTSGYEENIETTQNRFYEDRHKALKLQMSDEDQEKIKSTLSSIVLFKQMFDTQDDLEQKQIIESMFERVCQHDEVVISQGDEGNYFYVIMSGAFDVYVKSPGGEPAAAASKYGKRVAQLKHKGYFGELALLYNQPRSATIICVEDGSTLYCLNRKNFQELMIKNSFKRRQTYKVLLKSVPLLRDALGEAEISKVADALSSKVFKPGELIFRQNDEPNGIYFVESGQVNIVQEASNQSGQRFLLRRLKLGEYFGEVALINKSPRSASAYADEASRDTCRVAFLDLNAFERLLGPCVELFKSKMVDYKNI